MFRQPLNLGTETVSRASFLSPLHKTTPPKRSVQSRVIHDDIETPERIHRHLHSRTGRILICHVERAVRI
jgi:hypothetical protein